MCGARSSDTRFPLKGTPPSVWCPCRCAAPFGSRGPIKPRASYAAGRARRSWSVCQNSLSPCGRVPWDLAVCACGRRVLSNPGFHRDSSPPFLGWVGRVRVGLRPSPPWQGVVPAPPASPSGVDHLLYLYIRRDVLYLSTYMYTSYGFYESLRARVLYGGYVNRKTQICVL